MKIDRQDPKVSNIAVKLRFTRRFAVFFALFAACCFFAKTGSTNPPQTENPSISDPNALALIDQVIERLAHGRAFYCKIRQRIRTGGLEVNGVGSYQQVGGGTSQFYMHIDLHDGNGKHTLHQVSDGRLAWTSRNIAGQIFLSRVDLGHLDEAARVQGLKHRIKPSMKVGGLTEMLDSIRIDYDLSLGKSTLDGRELLVLIGNLKPLRRQQIEAAQGSALPEMYPTRVNVAIAQEDSPETGIGRGLPVRIEHLSDPMVQPSSSNSATPQDQAAKPKRRMISLLELYRMQPIQQPPIEQFQVENQDTEIDFVNETKRYEDRFNIRISAKELAKYR